MDGGRRSGREESRTRAGALANYPLATLSSALRVQVLDRFIAAASYTQGLVAIHCDDCLRFS